jgi:hypothetical protein
MELYWCTKSQKKVKMLFTIYFGKIIYYNYCSFLGRIQYKKERVKRFCEVKIPLSVCLECRANLVTTPLFKKCILTS